MRVSDKVCRWSMCPNLKEQTYHSPFIVDWMMISQLVLGLLGPCMVFMPRMNMRIMSNELPVLSNELWLTIETGHLDLEPSTFAVEMLRKHDLP